MIGSQVGSSKIENCVGLVASLLSTSHFDEAVAGAAANEYPADRIPWCHSRSAKTARIEAFRQGLRELGYVEGKNIAIEWRFAEGKLDRLPALAAELVRLKVDIIVSGGPAVNPCRQGSDYYDSHCHGAGPRSCWERVCRQPGAAWRKHHWIVNSFPGAKRKTTGASEGDCSQALPRGRDWEISRAGLRTIVKRYRTRRWGVEVKLQYLDVRDPKDIETAFRAASKERADAVLLLRRPSYSQEHRLSNSR